MALDSCFRKYAVVSGNWYFLRFPQVTLTLLVRDALEPEPLTSNPLFTFKQGHSHSNS